MVIAELQKMPPAVRGPGSLHRIIAEAQRTYLRLGPMRFALATASIAGCKWCGSRTKMECDWPCHAVSVCPMATGWCAPRLAIRLARAWL